MTSLLLSALRHGLGYLVVLPAFLLAIALQALIVGPLCQNRTTIPRWMFRTCGRLFGVRFQLNPASAPFAPDRPTLFLSNHLSRLDFAGLSLFPDVALLMNAMFFRMPVFGPIIRIFANSAGIVGTEQTAAGKRQDQQALAQAVEAGRNIFVYAEGIQSDGRRLLRYSHGAAEILYDARLLADHPALGRVQVQPVIYRVKDIDGQDMLGSPEKWGPYSLSQGRRSIFAGMSRQTRISSTTIDILVCPALEPTDYPNAAALVTAVHEVARKLIAPDQTRTMTRREWKRRLDVRDFSL